jgi:secondary thiamine-phosphate synthase enzyme
LLIAPLPFENLRKNKTNSGHEHRTIATIRGVNRSSEVIAAMLSHTKYLTVKVPERMDFVNITDEVEKAVKESRVREGLCLVNAMHITASVFINDDEPGLHEDYKRWLEWLAPYDPSPERYHHNRTGEDNGDAHHKRQVMGREVVVAITAGKLDFGPWEQIFYGEFDGRRSKRILIKIIGE